MRKSKRNEPATLAPFFPLAADSIAAERRSHPRQMVSERKAKRYASHKFTIHRYAQHLNFTTKPDGERPSGANESDLTISLLSPASSTKTVDNKSPSIMLSYFERRVHTPGRLAILLPVATAETVICMSLLETPGVCRFVLDSARLVIFQ